MRKKERKRIRRDKGEKVRKRKWKGKKGENENGKEREFDQSWLIN